MDLVLNSKLDYYAPAGENMVMSSDVREGRRGVRRRGRERGRGGGRRGFRARLGGQRGGRCRGT